MNNSLPGHTDEPTGPDHPVSRIQTDIFCPDCGDNLYDRPVWRTEDTGLLVATCDRCGKIAPANEALPYRRVWRQRLGVTLMLGWMLLLGGSLATIVGFECAIQMEPVRMNYERVDATSRDYTRRMVTSINWDRTQDELLWMVPMSLALTFAAGCFLVCTVYHWRIGWHLLAAIAVPAIAMGFVWLARNGGYRNWFAIAAPVILAVAALQIGGGLVGVLVGRPVGRWVIRVLLPNRGRKYFAFLWRRDGKELPQGPF